MFPAGRQWYKQAGASPAVLTELRRLGPSGLPSGYFDLLSLSNGGEGPLSRQPLWFVLDSADEAIDAIRSRRHAELSGLFFVFGSNGGGEYVAFDLRRPAPWPVVAIDMTNADFNESVLPIAPNFESFLALVGVGESDI